MKSSRLVSLAACALIVSSTFTADAGVAAAVPATHSGHINPAVAWTIFGCAGGIIVAAFSASTRQHRQLTPYEAATCGAAYWFTFTKP